MDRRIVFSIVGVALIGLGLWLTTRTGQDETEVPQALRQESTRSIVSEPAQAAAHAAVDAGRLSAEAPESPGEPAGAAPTAVNPPPQAAGGPLPIDVSPGFEFLSKPSAEMKDTDPMWTHWRRHQQLESEPVDETWAPRMEAALRAGVEQALTARGLDTQRIELPVVECRTNGCEIQAVGYAMDNMKPGVDFQDILPSLLRGTLEGEFDLSGFSLLVSSRADGRLIFLATMPRKKN